MVPDGVDRRSFLKTMGSAGLSTAFPAAAFGASPFSGAVVEEKAEPAQDAAVRPAYSVRFSVCGHEPRPHLRHGRRDDAWRRRAGRACSRGARAWSGLPEALPAGKVVATQDEIINDPSIQLVLSSQIANERAPLGIRAMKHGKDFLSDKPGVTTLETLPKSARPSPKPSESTPSCTASGSKSKPPSRPASWSRPAPSARSSRPSTSRPIRSSRHGGDAGGGRPPRLVLEPRAVRRHPLRHRLAPGRSVPLLHRLDRRRSRAHRRSPTSAIHDQPNFQDFGDMMLRGNRGFGYVRLDWFTPDGLGTWGDGRLFILGTDGYIEVRKYTDVAVEQAGQQPLHRRSESRRAISTATT